VYILNTVNVKLYTECCSMVVSTTTSYSKSLVLNLRLAIGNPSWGSYTSLSSSG